MPTLKISGFKFAGVACGIKKSKKRDLALIFSERPAAAAALFTTNRIKSPAVLVGMKRVRKGKVQAVVINSGNANACTGAQGLRDAEAVCRKTAAVLGIDPMLVVPSSTGIIGVPLPMDKLIAGVATAATRLSTAEFNHAAEAILTTDRFIKVSSATCMAGGKKIRIAGMVKGAGMIAPNMATMLAYILTDAAVEPGCLRFMLREAANVTFNSVTVDGDMSTNDTVLILANGFANNSPVKHGSKDEAVFLKKVQAVMQELALRLVKDGEGATKVVEIRVEGAKTFRDAKKIANCVARSQLVKTAFYGEDPNFGRVMCAVGYAGVRIQPEKIDLLFDRVAVVRKGVGIAALEKPAARVLKRPSFAVTIRLGLGNESASVWTSDLSHEYVRINSAYRT